MSNETYCVNAFHGLTVRTNGCVTTCCMAERYLAKSVKDESLATLFNDDFFKNIRSDLSQGIKSSNCNKCWDEESSGRKSKRLRDNEILNFKEDAGLKILDLNLGNLCNIKCRTCGPWNSSKWVDESYYTSEQSTDLDQHREKYKQFRTAFDDESFFWESVNEVLPSIVQIDCYGGEPFLSKKQWSLIKTAVEQDFAKNIKVHYNTNGTIWVDEQVELLSNMRIADIAISIDGIGNRFEYMRHMASWEIVDANIKKAIEWANKNSNVTLTLCYTISPLNIWYIPEILDYGKELGINVYLNLVHFPDYYNIQNIPESVKSIIEQHLLNYPSDTDSNKFWIDSIIGFMKQKQHNPEVWKEFVLRTNIHDKYRQESYKETFPEFYKIIQSHL